MWDQDWGWKGRSGIGYFIETMPIRFLSDILHSFFIEVIGRMGPAPCFVVKRKETLVFQWKMY
jgi:hypothetical protein